MHRFLSRSDVGASPVARHEWLAGTVKIVKTPECGRHLRCRIRLLIYTDQAHRLKPVALTD